MRYIRPFDRAALAAGGSQGIVGDEDGVDCRIDLRRGGGGGGAARRSAAERLALVLAGTPRLRAGAIDVEAVEGDLIFVPADVEAAIDGDEQALWIEIAAPVRDGSAATPAPAKVVKVDHARFEGAGFAYQSLIDRSQGSATMRINVLQVEPGSGSPDFHIHAFAQLYVIQDGAMTLDVGRQRFVAERDTVVVLPAGVVHRNYNAAATVERHISLLVPEPRPDEIFDFAVTIHDREAELLTAVPA